MITPLFECQQDGKTVTVLVRAPHSRPRDIDISVIDRDLHFHCHPYLLHLRFPHPLSLDPEENPASYDIGTGIATIPLLKSVHGQYFERLDMLSTLLVSRKKANFATGCHPPSGPNIEVLSSEQTSSVVEQTSRLEIDADDGKSCQRPKDSNSLLPAMRADPVLLVDASRNFRENVADVAGVEVAMSQLSVGRPRYGFGARYEAIFQARAEDMSEIVELPEPDSTPVWRRPQIRRELEDRKFDAEHYVADFMLADEFAHVFQFSPDVHLEDRPLSNTAKDAMLKLPKREYLKEIDRHACADLAGLVYASCYDLRTTCGERNVESAWTISRLCASFSCLEAMRDPHSAVLAAYRRSLAYPLYRNTKLSCLVLVDTKRVMSCGEDIGKLRSRLLRLLLSLRQLFEEEKLLRIFSDIFLTDFCVWIQFVEDHVLQKLSQGMLSIAVDKSALGWDLFALESAALDVERGVVPTEMEIALADLENEMHVISNDHERPVDIVIRSPRQRGFEITPTGTSQLTSNAPGSCSFSSSSSSSADEGRASKCGSPDEKPAPASEPSAHVPVEKVADK